MPIFLTYLFFWIVWQFSWLFNLVGGLEFSTDRTFISKSPILCYASKKIASRTIRINGVLLIVKRRRVRDSTKRFLLKNMLSWASRKCPLRQAKFYVQVTILNFRGDSLIILRKCNDESFRFNPNPPPPHINLGSDFACNMSSGEITAGGEGRGGFLLYTICGGKKGRRKDQQYIHYFRDW